MIKMMRQAKCGGVLFTHYHGDHIGLMGKIAEQDVQDNPIGLYMGKRPGCYNGRCSEW